MAHAVITGALILVLCYVLTMIGRIGRAGAQRTTRRAPAELANVALGSLCKRCRAPWARVAGVDYDAGRAMPARNAPERCLGLKSVDQGEHGPANGIG